MDETPGAALRRTQNFRVRERIGSADDAALLMPQIPPYLPGPGAHGQAIRWTVICIPPLLLAQLADAIVYVALRTAIAGSPRIDDISIRTAISGTCDIFQQLQPSSG